MQTNSVSLEDCNSKYLQSQERFKSCKPRSKPGPVSFFGLVVFLGYQSSIFTSQKIRKYRGQKLDYRIDEVQRYIRGTDLQQRAEDYRVGLLNIPQQLSNIYNNVYFFKTWRSKSKYWVKSDFLNAVFGGGDQWLRVSLKNGEQY